MKFLFIIALVLAIAIQATPTLATTRMVLFEDWTNVF